MKNIRFHETERGIAHLRIVAILAAAILLALIIALFLLSGQNGTLSAAWKRAGNLFSYYVMGNPPHFYWLEGERNGKEFRLSTKDTLEISYRDEFVFRNLSSDDLTGRNVTVDVEGLGTGNDLRVLLKGVGLVDRILTSEIGGLERKTVSDYRIRIRYGDKDIAYIPIRVVITPQDWLRFARSSEKQSVQIESLKQAIALNRTDVGVRKMLAGIYLRSNRLDEAAAQYAEILQLKPGDRGAMADLATSYMRKKQYDKALPLWQNLVRTAPKDASIHANLGVAYGGLGEWEKAIESYKQAMRLSPDNQAVRFRLGEAFEKTGRTDKALEQYSIVIQKEPGDERVMAALANAFLRMKRYDDAIRWYREIVKKQPQNASAYANLGFAFGAKGQAKEEMEAYKKSLSLDPRNAVARYNLGTALEKAKRYSEAAEEYRQVLKARPDDGDALQRLADMALRLKQYDAAVKLYEKIVKLQPSRPAAYASLGYAYGELKKYKPSAESYEKALRLGSKDPQVHQNLAYAYEKLGRSKDAIVVYEKIAVGQPTIEILSTLASSYVKEKQFDKAVKAYTRMIEMQPKKAAGYSGLAYVYGLKGDTDRQIQNYRLALRYDAEDDVAYLGLGEAYEKKQMYAEALKAYSTAYGLNPDSAKAARKIPQMKIRMLQQKHKETGEGGKP